MIDGAVSGYGITSRYFKKDELSIALIDYGYNQAYVIGRLKTVPGHSDLLFMEETSSAVIDRCFIKLFWKMPEIADVQNFNDI